MKKSYFFVLAFFLCSILFPAEIYVTMPDGLDYWNIGETKHIKWNSSGDMDRYVKIRLFDKTGTTRLQAITDKTPNDGKFDWTIPQSLRAGEYIIRVKTLDNLVSNNSEVFHIQDRRLIKINLISPSGGARYEAPGTMLFKWEMESWELVEHVKLILKKGGQEISHFIADNNGSVSRPLTDNINNGTDYSIRIEDAVDPTIFDESGYFEIYHQYQPQINVTIPRKVVFSNGETLKIKWTCPGFDGKVFVELIKDSSPFRKLAGPIRDDFYNWKINELGGHLQYQIKVSSAVNNEIFGKSNFFLITNSTDLLVFSKRGIFGKEKYVKGERTSLRFRVRNPSTGPARTKVKVDINFVKGKIRRPSGISKRKMYLQALTRYTGNKLSYVDPNTDTLFDLPVSIADNPGDYTVIITITPTADKDLIIGNNTIYGYFKVVFKTLKLKIIK